MEDGSLATKGDKLRNVGSRTFLACLVVIGMTVAMARDVGAEPHFVTTQCDWSFKAHPFPTFQDMGAAERAILRPVTQGVGASSEIWEERFDAFRRAYLHRYPAFAMCLDEEGASRSSGDILLLAHLVRRFEGEVWTTGLGWLVRDRLRTLAGQRFAKTGRNVCSFTLPDAEDWPELADHLALSRRAVARGDAFFAMGLRVGLLRPPLHFNPDLTLYIDLVIDETDSDLLPEQAALSAARRDAVRVAERRADLNAVLTTTPTCPEGRF